MTENTSPNTRRGSDLTASCSKRTESDAVYSSRRERRHLGSRLKNQNQESEPRELVGKARDFRTLAPKLSFAGFPFRLQNRTQRLKVHNRAWSPVIRQVGRSDNVESNKWSNKKRGNPKCLQISNLSNDNSALLRRWLWVRAPPNPYFGLIICSLSRAAPKAFGVGRGFEPHPTQ
jgi:hypothetical protein